LLADAELSLFITALTIGVVRTAQPFQHDAHEKAETWATHIIIHFLIALFIPMCAAAFI